MTDTRLRRPLGGSWPARRHRRPPSADCPQLPFEKYTLPNGLEVILHEDHRMPEVVVDVWYKVGSKDEVPGRTGFAHLFEHVMFQGTKHVGEDKHFEYLQKAGASNVNGSTSADRTNYFEVVPSNQLELALWLESDRMGFLLDRPGLPRDARQPARRGQERAPPARREPALGLVSKVLPEALYPPQHPYYHEVIGSMEDLSEASVDDVKGFFRTYYAPGNATLDRRGRLRPRPDQGAGREVLRPDPGRGRRSPVRAVPRSAKLDAPKRVAMEAKVQQPQLYVSYLSPPSFAPGDRELDLIANLLANGKSSRLYRRLVYEMKIAQAVSASAGEPEAGEQLRDHRVAHARPHARRAAGGDRRRGRQAAPRAAAPRELDAPRTSSSRTRSATSRGCSRAPSGCRATTTCWATPGSWARTCGSIARSTARRSSARPRSTWARTDRVVVTVEPNPDAPIMGRVKK